MKNTLILSFLFFALLPSWLNSAGASEPKSVYCVFQGFLSGKAVSATRNKYQKIAASKKIDLDVSALKANKPGPDGTCHQPTCKKSGEFGIDRVLMGRIESCTNCGESEYSTLEVEFQGYRYTLPSLQGPTMATQLKIQPSKQQNSIQVEKSKYDWIYVFCNNEVDAGHQF